MATPIWSMLLLPAVVIVVIVLAVLMWRGGAAGSRRRLRYRHPVTRIVCAALGVGVLVAVAVATWHDVRALYAGEPPAEPEAAQTVRVPSKPIPPRTPGPGDRRGQIEVHEARILAYAILAEPSGEQLVPTQVCLMDLHWGAGVHGLPAGDVTPPLPEGSLHSAGRAELVLGDRVFTLEARITGSLQESVRSGKRQLLAGMDTSVHSQRRGLVGRVWRTSSRGQRWIGRGIEELDKTVVGAPAHPLSIAGSQPNRPMAVLWMCVEAAQDDPLTEITMDEFAARYPMPTVSDVGLRVFRDTRGFANGQMQGLSLAVHLGPPAALLLVAAALLSQVFRRRGLALAGMLVVVILFVAAADRLALGAHLSRLADEAAHPATRMLACREATNTFFYRATALDEIGAIAKAEAAPDHLRYVARESAGYLRRAMRYETR